MSGAPTPGRGPVLIDYDAPPAAGPDVAAPVPDLAQPGAPGAPDGRAMRAAIAFGARGGGGLGRWLLVSGGALVAFVVSLAAWTFVTGLVARSPVLGAIATVLVAVFVAVLLAVALRELVAFARLARLDAVHKAAVAALAAGDLGAARAVTARLEALYAHRADTAWGRAEIAARRPDILDADGLLALVERSLFESLDAAARREVEAAARQVATVTAVVPLALADVVVALTANLRMIRRIAEIYGGRAGTVGSLRMARAVFSHLVATGAVAVGDDLIGSVAGGGLLSKVSRRFGEGVVNGALTARVGVAAMEVCRPMPFGVLPMPRVTRLVQRALTGLFGRGDGTAE